MQNLKATLQEIIPIRFIEYYTARKLGPESIARLFAHKEEISWHRKMDKEDKLTAYHLRDCEVVAMKRIEWDAIVDSIKSLTGAEEMIVYGKTDKHVNPFEMMELEYPIHKKAKANVEELQRLKTAPR